MAIALLLALSIPAPQAPPSVTDIQARIPKSFCVVSVALAGWHEDRPEDHPLGEKLLMSGTMAGDAMLTLIVEANEPPVSPQVWRQRLAPGGKPFDVQADAGTGIGAIACTDVTTELIAGIAMANYHAFVVTRTHSLDLHVSGTPATAHPRSEFEKIVKSLRVLLLRRGLAEDYPAAIAAPMTTALVLGADQKEWCEGYLAAHADDWAAQFAHAECLHDLKAPLDRQLAAYEKALALAGKVPNPDAKMQFAIAMLLEGKSLALYDGKRFADSIAPLDKACAMLQALKHPERGGPAYNLACAHARCKHEGPALAALGKAIEAAPRYREAAAKDSDFAALAKSAAFKKLIAAPAGEASPRKE